MRKLSLQTQDLNTQDLDDLHHSSNNEPSFSPHHESMHHAYQSQPSESQSSMSNKRSKSGLVFAIIAIVAGIFTGYGSAHYAKGGDSPLGNANSDTAIQQIAGDSVKKGDVFGSKDQSAFKDTAEGYLESGGLDGEGSHQLLRPGGESQTVYLTSSVTDLDKLVGMEVKVWGETFKGQKAGWLMDVGRIEIIEPEGTAPSEE